MKTTQNSRFAAIILMILFAVSASNCAVRVGTHRTHVKAKPLPPGQAKKITGEKSARNHAPGHNK